MLPSAVAERYARDGWWGSETLPQRFASVCAAHADRIALVDGEIRLTFAEVSELVERVAGHLHGLGVEPGRVVSWQLPNWWEAAVLHHAVLRIGAIPNPLNPTFRARELRHVLREAEPALLVVPEQWRGFDHIGLAKALRDAVGVRHMVVRGEACTTLTLEPLLVEPSAPAPPVGADASALALLLYTSGTTSDPKGVLHTHRSLLCEIESFREIHSVTPEDRYCGGAPVAHIAGLVYGLLTPFALGTSTVLLDRWDPARAAALIERQHITFMTGPPTFLQTLAEHAGAHDTSSFRLFSTGGASITTDLVRAAGARLGCVVKRAYGSTEVPTLTATRIDDDERARLESDGRVLGGAEMRIVRADGGDADPGEEGEIWARAPEMFVGYRDAGLEAFTDDGWFRTGDLGRVDERGLLRVTGRIKDIIIRGGENISAKEIEDLLVEHPAVAEAAVVGMPDPVLGERVCAFVAVRDGARFTFDEMVAFLEARETAKQKLPERLEVRDALPKTDSGKIVKAQLRAELLGS